MPPLASVPNAEFVSVINADVVGDFNAPLPAKQEWASQEQRYRKCMRYFSGEIFTERSEDAKPGEPAPLLYPLQINIVKQMCLSQAGALWGQFEGDLVNFRVDPLGNSQSARERADEAKTIIVETWQHSNVNTLLYEAGLLQQELGGVYVKIANDPTGPHGFRFQKLDPNYVFVIYHPLDVDRIVEAWIALPIDKTEAARAFGYAADGLPEETLYLEHWTEKYYEVFIGGNRLEGFSRAHTWGRVPIRYIPRLRCAGFYGLPLAEDLMGLQDELNARLADMGDRVNDAAHPTYWVRNYRGNAEKDFVRGPDTIFDLGQQMGDATPEVGVLEGQSEPPSSFKFIEYLQAASRQAAQTSGVAFGEDEGSQRSGQTLALRLWPLLQQARGTRLFWRDALRDLGRMLLVMAQQRDGGRYKGGEQLAKHVVSPLFADLVPQDRALLIDEIIRRAERDLISPEEAVARFGTVLGTDDEEVERLKDWMQFKAELAAKSRPAPTVQPGTQKADGSTNDATQGASDGETKGSTKETA